MPFFPALPELRQPDLSQPIQNALAMYGGLQQAKAQNLKMKMAEDEMQRAGQFRNALQGFDPANPEAANSAIMNALRADPERGIPLMNAMQAQGRERRIIDKERMAQAKDAVTRLAVWLDGAPDEQKATIYPQARQSLLSQFPELEQELPAEYDANLHSQVLSYAPADVQLKLMEQKQLKYGAPVAGVDESGNEAFYRPDQLGGMNRVPGVKPRPKDGLGDTIEMKDGTVINLRGGSKKQSASGLSPATQNKVEESLLDSTRSLSAINTVKKLYRPEFQQLGTRLGATTSGWSEKLGQNLNPSDKKGLMDLYAFRSSAGRLLAEDLKAMSGAAITPQEAERAKTFIPDPGTGVLDGDSPSVLESKMKSYEAFVRRMTARANFIRKNGFSIDNAPPELMGDIFSDQPSEYLQDDLSKRGREIDNELREKSKGIPEDQLRQMVMKQLADEYGLVFGQ